MMRDFLKIKAALLLICLLAASVRADELQVSSKEPLVVNAPADWKATKEKIPAPFETYKITPPGNRNAACLISVLGKGKQEFFDA
ncbi:MAG TPA: hypothetical protein VGE41_03120, partial [Verrucomicrobiae bacterium]